MIALRTICLMVIMLFGISPAHAAEIRAHLLIDIDSEGLVNVTQRWSGLGEIERLSYDTRTAELGVLECSVLDGNAIMEYSSKALLKPEGDRLRLIIAKLEHAGEWLDFDVTLRYPGNLEFLNSDPEPSFTSSVARGLMWSLADQRELTLLAVFRPFQPGAAGEGQADAQSTKEANQEGGSSRVVRKDEKQPADQGKAEGDGAVPPDAPGDTVPVRPEQPTTGSDELDAPGETYSPARQELLLDGDPLLLEFRLLIGAAAREGKADEDFLQALEKLLLKFYYLLDAMGATDEYEPRD
jgi:hypothetical protein